MRDFPSHMLIGVLPDEIAISGRIDTKIMGWRFLE